MELTFSKLKQKDVINLCDGKNYGRVCDLSFTDSDFGITAFVTTGGKGIKFFRQELTVPVRNVVKIGEDAVLVDIEEGSERPPQKGERGGKRSPKEQCPPRQCPPQGEQKPVWDDRRSYDEYE